MLRNKMGKSETSMFINWDLYNFVVCWINIAEVSVSKQIIGIFPPLFKNAATMMLGLFPFSLHLVLTPACANFIPTRKYSGDEQYLKVT